MRKKKQGRLALILGGARSGKSRFALDLLARSSARPSFVATAEVLDAEMAERVRQHKLGRGARWGLIEEPLDVARVVSNGDAEVDGLLVDCLTLWLSNVLLKEGADACASRTAELGRALDGRRCDVVLVANEVGLGIVPENALARTFRDAAGRLNQELAARADTVVFMAAGLPLVLKDEAGWVDSKDAASGAR